MHRSTTRWTTAAAAAALLALPVAGAAQTTGTTPQQPPASTQPQPQPQEPTAQPQPGQPAAAGQVDAAAAKKHLSDARESLSQITSMPEAAKLQGDARTQVSQLISNFNELITTQSEWRASYGKVAGNLTTLLGPEAADPNAAAATPVGTSGSGIADLDPAIRTKLTEFRSHLKLFEQAAGGGSAASGAMAPSAATGSTTNPANPASAPANPDPSATTSSTPAQPSPTAQPAPTGQPTSAGATGTSGVTPSPTATMAPGDQAKAAEQVGHAEADKQLDAITAILNQSKTGALTKAQTTELKKHVEQLRALLKQGK